MRCRFIQDKNRRVFQQRPRDRQPLPLPPAEFLAAFADDCLEAVGHSENKILRQRVPGRLADLFGSIAATADWSRIQWVQFQTIKLERWSAGRVAILGDAAHAMPPNLAQGAGCAMMNALALAVTLDETSNLEQALADWEQRERPLVEHTQFWSSLYSSFTVWPEFLRSIAFSALGRFAWLRRRYQRTANHIPTGYRSAASSQEIRL